jgi:hypothetical protein
VGGGREERRGRREGGRAEWRTGEAGKRGKSIATEYQKWREGNTTDRCIPPLADGYLYYMHMHR